MERIDNTLARRSVPALRRLVLALAAIVGWTSIGWAQPMAPPQPTAAPPRATTAPAGAATAPATPPANLGASIVITGTLEAAMEYPRVEVQVRLKDRVLTGQSTGAGLLRSIKDLADLVRLLEGKAQDAMPDQSFSAILDTGASAHVLSRATAERFGVEAVPGAVYHETGLHGETPMGVSLPYSLSISGTDGDGAPTGGFHLLQEDAALQLSHDAAANPLIEMVMGEVNIIGMPAIRKLLVEIVPSLTNAEMSGLAMLAELDLSDLEKPGILEKLAAGAGGPAVKLHGGAEKPGAHDLEVLLRYTDFSRRKNPHDKGPLPELAANPTVVGVRAELSGNSFVGTWLLDTGAPASLISTKQALALGVYGPDGKPRREEDFSLPLGGIGGSVKPVPGYRIDRLVIPAANGKTLEYQGLYVLVTDVSVVLDDGQVITLDGVLGTNLWFPTVSGLRTGLPTAMSPSPWEVMWIDGPGGRLLLKLRKQ
jgi:hypothetical protein